MDDIEKLIPDFDTLEKLVLNLSVLKARLIVLEHSRKVCEAECIKEAMVNTNNWVGSKQPTAAYCDSVVKVIGNTDADKTTLIEIRKDLAELTGDIECLERTLQLNADRLDLFRSLNADRRKSFLS